ncbi:MAG: hypothetical protein AB8G26_03460 [Ilumatobacter sp.]
MNVILRFEPAAADQASNVIRSGRNDFVYGTGPSGDVAGLGGDDAATAPSAATFRRPRWTSLLAAASIVALVVGVASLDSGSDAAELTGAEVKTEILAEG